MNWIVVAAILGSLAVAFGAFGAHGLRTSATPEQLSSWSPASQYQLLHSIALLALALFSATSCRPITLPASLWTAGMICFSGSIYLLVLSPQSWLGLVTPLGGLLLIAGWLALLRIAQPL